MTVPTTKVAVEPKSKLASKTVWFNVITTTITVAEQLAQTGLIPIPIMPVIMGLGNLILRVWFTQAPLK